MIPGRTPTSSLGEAFDALFHGLGKTAASLFPDVYAAGTQGHALLAAKTLHDHREYAQTYGMEDDFGIPSSTDADVCACRRHDVGKDGEGRERRVSRDQMYK
jgi:hypothetical protein